MDDLMLPQCWRPSTNYVGWRERGVILVSFCCVHYINFNNDSYEDQYVEDTYQEDYAEYV